MATKTFEEAFEEFKKVPDWDRFPLPEFMYEKYGIKKPRTGDVMDIVTYTAPPHESLNKNGKVELLPLAEGGVRKIELGPELPVEVQVVQDETPETNPTEVQQKNLLPDLAREASVSELSAYLKNLEASLKD
jgi:hypothetical protein